MRARQKLSKTRKKIRKWIAVTLLLAMCLTCWFEFQTKIQLTAVIVEELEKISETAVNRAVQDFLTGNADIAENLLTIHYSDAGEVRAISTNAAYINRAKTAITELSQRYIDALSAENGIAVPLGSLSGVVFLSSVGPDVRLDVESKQTVRCAFESTFESTGLNQTIHHISLTVTTDITVYNPFRIYDPIIGETDFEIAQTVIVGSIPSAYGGYLTY